MGPRWPGKYRRLARRCACEVCVAIFRNFLREDLSAAVQLEMLIARPSDLLPLLTLLSLVPIAKAQTSCATENPGIGVFICFPSSSVNGTDAAMPNLFHLSAQANAADGQLITRYRVLIDNRQILDNPLAIPLQNLSIESNLKAPFESGSHTLQLLVAGVGSAEVKGLQIHASKNGACDPFSRFDPRTCSISIRAPLHWSLPEPASPTTTLESAAGPEDAFAAYVAYVERYSENLKSIEADASDAVAVDAEGNTYVALHSFADVELRKYAPDGSIVYDSLLRACGDGFLSVAGLAIDNAGRAWIAGNTTACLPTTPNAFQGHTAGANRMRGFVMLVDTAKAGSAPLALTYLSGVDNRIAAIRMDHDGNAFVTGVTTSLEFPHDSILNVKEGSAGAPATRLGFVSVLNSSGSRLLWSALLPDVQLTALALDTAENVYVTGRMASGSRRAPGPTRTGRLGCGANGKLPLGCDDVLIAALSDRGRRLSYVATIGGSGEEEGRAISIDPQGHWIFVAGDTESPDFPVSSGANQAHRAGLQPFVIALQPCKTGILSSRLITASNAAVSPGVAMTPALDAVATAFPGAAAPLRARAKVAASVLNAPACSADVQ